MDTVALDTPRPGMTYGLDGRWQPARRDPAERAKRDARIRALHAESWSLRAIAADVGCSHRTVRRVVYERT